MADRVQHVGLDPEGIASPASPDTQAGRRSDRLASDTPSHNGTGRIRVHRVTTRDLAQGEALPARRVTLIEGEAVGHALDGVAVKVDLDFVHPHRMIARHENLAGNRAADVDYEGSTRLAFECIEVRDVETDVLPSDR